MNEEYSDYRYIPDDNESPAGSSMSVFTVGDKIKVLASSRKRIIGVDIELTVNDARWLAEHLTLAVNTIAASPESEAAER